MTRFIIFTQTKYYWDGQIKEGEMDRAYSMRMRNALKILFRIYEGRDHLEKLSEMNIEEVKYNGVHQGWVLMNVVVAFGFIEGRDFLGK
jgi:hypothetical protein